MTLRGTSGRDATAQLQQPSALTAQPATARGTYDAPHAVVGMPLPKADGASGDAQPVALADATAPIPAPVAQDIAASQPAQYHSSPGECRSALSSTLSAIPHVRKGERGVADAWRSGIQPIAAHFMYSKSACKTDCSLRVPAVLRKTTGIYSCHVLWGTL